MASSSQAPNIFEDTTRAPTKPSVLRAILSSKAHRRHPSADDAVSSQSPYTSKPPAAPSMPLGEGPSSNPVQLPLGERASNSCAPDGPPSSGQSTAREGTTGLHKKTRSAVSLKSLRNYMERKDSRADEPPEDEPVHMKPKKTKSAHSLTAILKRSQRERKGGDTKEVRDKENRSPSDLSDSVPSPTWMSYSNRPSEEQTGQRRQLEKGRNLEEEVSLYTPKGYSPAQQRNFYDYHQPSLTKRSDLKSRPKSDCLSGNRKLKDILSPSERTPSDKETAPKTPETSHQCENRGLSRPPVTWAERERRQESIPKEASRVQAAISAFNAKGQNADLQRRLNLKDLEGEFEKLLDARNIPHNMRDRMRSLDTNIKAEFIQKDRTDNTPQSANASALTSDSSRGRGKEQKEERHSRDGKGSRSRSRSRGFSFSKGGSSPMKRLRPDSGSFYGRPKSLELSQPIGLSRILTPSTSTASLSGAACVDTASDPSDFVHYLREIQKPEMIDAGKLHKLRILLRNETVSWVDDFITEGGMDEVVQLLYRIMKVEWRGEHEDTLLHEALLCLKALGTTSAALKRLTDIESELFSALLRMLFDEENKGPSEFTTRGIIINLLFTQLSTASSNEIAAARSLRILSYLRDPALPEESQPLSFIANIYQSRPYRVWCKEITNVTKEVFWIFLHHLNVVPVVSSDKATFRERHFPVPRPPVPAAPYVGGVEWDATNYLAAHLDLMNGLIACLPTASERNSLRTELRASGFEKVMGGSLRTCKEKFYSSIHDCLRTWIAAAVEDGWPYAFVREGPPRPEPGSPTKSPAKAGGSPKKAKADEKPPKLDLGLELPGERESQAKGEALGNWL